MPTDSIPRAEAGGPDPSPVPHPALEASSLRASLARGDIGVLYQPIVSTRDRRLVMVEALARWPAGRAPVSPEIFVPFASSAGLIRPLSEAVIRVAVRDLGWLRRRMRIGATINLPLEVIRHPDLPHWMRQVLDGAGLRPGDIAIELTENTVIHDRGELGRILRRLHACGFRVMLDDVGIDDPRAWLFDLDLKGLKLDRSFVQMLGRSARARHVLRRMVKAANARGQVLVAEGVADPAQLRMLAELGVHLAQGFFMSRPLPASGLFAWSERWRGSHPL